MIFFNRLKLRAKLLLVVSALMLFVIAAITVIGVQTARLGILEVSSQVAALGQSVMAKQKSKLLDVEKELTQAEAKALRVKGDSMAGLVAVLAATPLLTYETEKLDGICDSVCQDPDVVLCFVADAEGEIQSTFSNAEDKKLVEILEEEPKGISEAVTQLNDLKSVIKVESDIVQDEMKLGKVVVFLNSQGEQKQGGRFASFLGQTQEMFEELNRDIEEKADMLSIKALVKGVSAGVIALLVTTLVLWFLISRSIIRPIVPICDVTRRFALGDFRLQGADCKEMEWISDRHDELGDIGKAYVMLTSYMEEKEELSSAIANGDMTSEALLASSSDMLGQSFKTMSENLNEILSRINQASSEVASGAGQVSNTSQSLSLGSNAQAGSLQEITSAMTDLNSRTKSNAENASQANQLSILTRESASKGNDQMQEMISAMNEINDSSKEIAKIIKTIDDIAFQTNLLALNAAVEAARAGKHGKGFAVVAQEVRNLAGKSAKAARETAELIEGSVEKVQKGTEIVDNTAKSLKEIVEAATKVTDLVGEIAAASNEQAQGISQVNQGLNQVEQVTQQNTANAEETAAAAEELSSQAKQLRQLVSRFKLKGKEREFTNEKESEHVRVPRQLIHTPSKNNWG